MLYLLFFAMLIAFVGALIALPALMAPLVPWWGVVLIVVGELVVLRYTLFRILGFFFGVFVWAGLRVGIRVVRGTKVDVHSVTVVPRPVPEQIIRRKSGSVDEDGSESGTEGAADAPGTRYVRVECTVTPSPRMEAAKWPIEPGTFKISSEGFRWPSMPPKEDETRTGEPVAAAVLDEAGARPLAPDEHLLGRQRLALTFKCPPTLRGRAKLKYLILPLAMVDVP
jgi:hypothetical protein